MLHLCNSLKQKIHGAKYFLLRPVASQIKMSFLLGKRDKSYFGSGGANTGSIFTGRGKPESIKLVDKDPQL